MPLLKNYPVQYIHEPWTAPEHVQKAARCVVGMDYPKPIIDHEMASKQNQERMRQVYQHLSTYRNTKTPEENEHKTAAGETFVSANKNSNTTLTVQQREEQTQLMPAPEAPSSSQAAHLLQKLSCRQPNTTSIILDLPTGTGSGVELDDQALEIDALTPSINNYQSQVDNASYLKDQPNQAELDDYQTQFLDVTESSGSKN